MEIIYLSEELLRLWYLFLVELKTEDMRELLSDGQKKVN